MSATPATDTGLAGTLAKVRAEIDRALAKMPESRLEARRRITRELAFDPSPEQLQTIVKMAHDPIGRGALEEIARRSLALRILIDREMREVFDGAELDSTSISRVALVMPGLVQAVAELEEEIHGSLLALKDEEREYVLQIGDSLIPATEPLVAATVIAPRLALFAYAAQRGQLGSAQSALTEEDIELFKTAVGTEEDRTEACVRTCINAVVLRTAIRDDLVAWASATEALGNKGGAPQGLLQRLERDATAYHVIAEHLQKRQDTALLAGLQGFADALRRSKQDLFSTYLELAAALKSTSVVTKEKAAGQEVPDDLKRLLEECSTAEAAIVSEQAAKVSTDQLCVDALNRLTNKDTTPVIQFAVQMGVEDLRREKGRIKSLLVVTGILLGAVLIVYGTLLGSQPEDIHVSLLQVSGRLRPSRVVSLGPLMYAQLDRWTWNRMPEGQRVAQVTEFGEDAARKGFSAVYLTDENDVDLAHWTKTDGAKLLKPGAKKPDRAARP